MVVQKYDLFLRSFIALSFFLAGCSSIKLQAVLVPQFRFRGQNASLLCKYELEPNEELFSLKWYKEDTEFYRYTLPITKAQQPLVTHQQQQQQQQQRQQRQKDRDWRKAGGGGGSLHIGAGGSEGAGMGMGMGRHMARPPAQPEGHVQSWKVAGIKIDVSEESKDSIVYLVY